MVELHTMVPAWNLPTFTPFGLKLETYMRMAAIPYTRVVEHDPRHGPKRKFPWIVDEGTVVADSGFVVEYLVAKYGDRLDHWLDGDGRAALHAFRRMIEESLCFAILYFRWTDDDIYRKATNAALISIPRMIRPLITPLIRRRVLRDLWGQGVGRHARAEALALGTADLDALAQRLGHSTFMLGERPSSLDATAYAFLAVLLLVPLETELKAYARTKANLVAYCDRVHSTYFLRNPTD